MAVALDFSSFLYSGTKYPMRFYFILLPLLLLKEYNDWIKRTEVLCGKKKKKTNTGLPSGL